MHDRSAVHRWLPAVFGLFFAAIVGFWAYDLGLSHARRSATASAAGRRVSLGVLQAVGIWTVLSAVLPRVLVLRAPDLFLQGWSVAPRVARVL